MHAGNLACGYLSTGWGWRGVCNNLGHLHNPAPIGIKPLNQALFCQATIFDMECMMHA